MPAGVAVQLLLTMVSGGLIAGLLDVTLTFAERCAIAVVIGLVGSAGLGYMLASASGLSAWTALGGPIALAAVAGIALIGGAGNPLPAWCRSWRATRDAPPWVLLGITGLATVFFILIFRRAMVERDGSLLAGYQTVWSDWSQHATTASSFAAGQNFPPINPLLSGEPLLYPFLPDFHSAMLLALDWGMGPALAWPGAILCVAISVLVISLAHRLSGSFLAGGLALAICVLGGGVGFVGYVQDACAYTVTGRHVAATTVSGDVCSWSSFAQHPLTQAGNVVRGLGPTLAAQPRAYDGLLASDEERPIGKAQQWYTPLMAWWLPQRSFLFGFGTVLSVLLLLHAAERAEGRVWGVYVVAGALAGALPVVHVHSLIVLALVVPWYVLRRRSREWLAFAGVAAALATPRLLQLSAGPKGTDAACNQFPWVEPGWMSQVVTPSLRLSPCGRPLAGIANVLQSGMELVHAAVLPGYWGFWIGNTGVLLPIMVLAGAGWAVHRWAPPPPAGDRVLTSITALFGPDLLRFCLPFLLVFAVANIVVFQSWDWDNTKLFAYWHFGAALLVAGALARWLRRGRGRAVVAALTVISLVLTGSLVMMRLLPWTPPAIAGLVSGPYAMADADQIDLARQIRAATPSNAVILTSGAVNDPALVLAGRTAFLGFQGWLSSYGTDFGTRIADAATMYSGCPAAIQDTACPSLTLLRDYGIQYAEILNDQPVGGLPAPGQEWWAQRFPVVASSRQATVYDVRGR
jgi:hypothetical protein